MGLHPQQLSRAVQLTRCPVCVPICRSPPRAWSPPSGWWQSAAPPGMTCLPSAGASPPAAPCSTWATLTSGPSPWSRSTGTEQALVPSVHLSVGVCPVGDPSGGAVGCWGRSQLSNTPGPPCSFCLSGSWLHKGLSPGVRSLPWGSPIPFPGCCCPVYRGSSQKRGVLGGWGSPSGQTGGQ